MELVRGASITEHAEAHGLDDRERLVLFAEVCDAVQHAHQRGVIHRDLKPGNILVDERRQPKVLDFGIARLIEREAALTRHTRAGHVPGTPAYMSPEQLDTAAAGDVDVRSDVYSLGVLLHELLTGSLPRARRTRAAGADRADADDPQNPGARRLSGDLGLIVQTALAQDRALRYQSVGDLAGDVRRLLNNQPILARGPGVGYVVGRFMRRHRAGVAAASVVAVVSMCLLAFAYVRIIQAEQEARRQYEVARGTVDFLINEVIEDLQRLSGTRPVNRRMMERLLGHSAAMLAEARDDVQLLANHAFLLRGMGGLEFEEGNKERSLELFQEALAHQQRLVAQLPDDPQHLMNLSLNHVLIGDAADRDMAHYMKALEIDRELVRKYPESRRYLDNLGHSYERIGKQYKRARVQAEAEHFLTCRLEIAEELMQRFPQSPKSVLGLCTANLELSEHMRLAGRYDDAVRHGRRAVDAADALQRINPDHLWYRRYVISSNEVLGAALDAASERELATGHLDRALAVAQQAIQENPADAWLDSVQRRITARKARVLSGLAPADEGSYGRVGADAR